MSSKLSLHITDHHDGAIEAIDSLDNAKFIKVMKLRPGIVEALKRLKRRCPTVMIGFRMYFEDRVNNDLNNWRQMCQDMLQYLHDHNGVGLVDLLFTPFNERFMLVELGLEEYVETLPKMAAHLRTGWKNISGGRKILIAGGNFPATTPRLNEWEIIEDCFDSLDFICIHEYAQPTMDDLPEVLYSHEEIIQEYPNIPPIIIGETGIDHALYTSPVMYKGWKHSLSPKAYASALDGYHDRIAGTGKVFAACVFQIGSEDDLWRSTYSVNHPDILPCFSREPNAQLTPHGDQQVYLIKGDHRTFQKDVDEIPKPAFSEEQLSGKRDWVPDQLVSAFADWRFTEGNTWPPHTTIERKEFWAHAARIGIDVKQFLSRKKPVVKYTEDYLKFVPTFAHLMAVDEILLRSIIRIESGGQPFGPNGMPLMRVEAHLLQRNAHDKASMAKIVRVQGPKSWQGHQYFENGQWGTYHNDQVLEQKVLALAAIVDTEAAFESTSYGLFQILGMHWKRLNYGSAEEMAKEMRTLDDQYMSFAIFCATGGCLAALREYRIEDFVAEFNGKGQVRRYSNLIKADIQRQRNQ